MLLLCYTIKEVSMEHDLKYALVITVTVFTVLIGFGLVAITSA
ncbi:membrane protein [Vibrio coralliilyticus]|uniref:Membrane protein n=2 Tax=Vibrio coralliilyticus TaxID=190893 RepID=A0A837G9A7_9VIBR|nr:membrane protein [Vibrio coralliilyticus]EEX33809.1 hypothetical protein VIC_001705 [Vibrio coralliilyticus ATCC BAA-450]KFI10525.1 membrane protein [Vibrio sp. B183]AIW18312.1 membrane protein [Vibrio coralliilyticus]KJY68333.1 membrane protein [Vibrio coralliilyticus]